MNTDIRTAVHRELEDLAAAVRDLDGLVPDADPYLAAELLLCLRDSNEVLAAAADKIRGVADIEGQAVAAHQLTQEAPAAEGQAIGPTPKRRCF